MQINENIIFHLFSGQNVPEGVILTTTTTTRPKITEISAENTQSLLSQETTTLRSPLTAYTTATTISVGKTLTTKQELKRKSNKKGETYQVFVKFEFIDNSYFFHFFKNFQII